MSSPLLSLLRSQETARTILERAVSSGRIHHAYLFTGPDGVGKELAAFGLAQALLCERRTSGANGACGACSACTRAVPREGERTALHPDLVIVERGLHAPQSLSLIHI